MVYAIACKTCKTRDELWVRRSYDFDGRDAICEGRMPKESEVEGWSDDWAMEHIREGGPKCDCCGERNFVSTMPMIERDSSWDSTGGHGVNGYFSMALGRHLEGGVKEERKIMESRGFIAESDLPPKWFDDKMNKRKEQHKQQVAYETSYKEALQSGKSKEEAVAETWTSADVKSGKLDSVYDTKITTK